MNVPHHRSIFRACSGFRVSRRHRRSTTQWLEPLEVRRLLTMIDWSSSTSGSWDVASNWSPEIVPGPSDDAVINVPGVTVTIGSNVESVNSLTASDTLAISGGGLTVAANSTISGGLAMTGGTLSANGSGVTLTVTGPTTVSTANLLAEGGATLSLAGLTSYTGGGELVGSTLQASGAGSILSLPNLQTLNGIPAYGSRVIVGPSSGGDVELQMLSQVTGPVQLSTGDGSGTLDVPQLATFTGGTLSYSGGNLQMPKLADADGTTFQIDDGATLTIPTVMEADGANFDVSGAAMLSLAGLTSYTGGGELVGSTLQASGAGSILSLPNLETLNGTPAYGSSVLVGPSSGGDVELPLLSQVTGPVQLSTSDGSGTLNVPQLATFTGGTLSYSGGNLQMPKLADADGTTFQIDSGVTLTMPTVMEADGANFDVSGAATLSLAGLTSYSGGGELVGSTLQASGAGSILSLPNLQTLNGIPAYGSRVIVGPSSGGDVELPLLSQVTGPVQLSTSDGSGTLDLSQLATFTDGTLNYSGGNLEMPALADAEGSTINVSGDSPLDLSDLGGATLDAASGTVNLPDLANADNSPLTSVGVRD